MSISKTNKRYQNTRNFAVTAIMGALGYLLMFIQTPLPFMPAFISLDFSDLPALLASFSCGPLWGVLAALMKNALHLPQSNTAFVGELSNFIIGAVFVYVAGLIYKKNKSKKGAVIASLAGALSCGIVGLVSNYFIVYPLYFKLLMPREAILGMYQEKLSSVNSLFACLTIFNLPFTVVKELIVCLITFLIYKPLSPILHGRKKRKTVTDAESEEPSQEEKGKN